MTEDSIDPVDSQETVDSSSQPEVESGYEQPQAEAQQVENYWDRFKSLPEFQGQDDRAIAGRLYQAMEREKAASRHLAQYQQVLPYAQEYLANKREFDAWRQGNRKTPSQSPQAAQAQQLQQNQPAAQKSWWNPPEVKEVYKRYLTKDEAGREVISPDAPLDARYALEEYQQYRADFAKKFLSDPEAALGPMVQDLASKQAQQIVEETLKNRDNEQYVSSLEKENADWLFDSETGQVTPEGFLVHKYIEEARDLGIQDPKKRWDHAVKAVERELLVQYFDQQQRQPQQAQYQQPPQGYQQQPAEQPQQPEPPQAQPQADLARQNMEYLRREAARNPSRSAGTTTNDPRAPKQKLSFEQMLLAEAGDKGLI
jgi:hypothetical protein